MATSWIAQLIIVIVSIIVGGLFTYFITTLTQRKMFKSIAQELTTYHEKIYHKKSFEDELDGYKKYFEDNLKEHQRNCVAFKDVGKLKTGVIWLVSQAGGNLQDLGLN